MQGERQNRIVYIVIVALAAVIVGIMCCRGKVMAAEETKRIKVALLETPGFSEKDEDGSYHGIIIDYLNEIAKYTGWKYEYVDADIFSYLDYMASGEYDLMGGMYYLPELENYFDYPDYNCGHNKSVLIVRKDDYSINAYNTKTMNGKVIGVFENAQENIRRMQQVLAIEGIDYTIKSYRYEDMTDGNLLEHLENNEVDVLLATNLDDTENYRIAMSFDAQPHYIVASKGNDELLGGLNYALEKILESNPDFAEECYRDNFPDTDKQKVFLNEDEIHYISRKKTIRVAVVDEYHPLFCINTEQAYHNGIIPDVLDKITEFSGLEFEYIYAESYADMLRMVSSNEADMAGFFLGTEEDAQQKGFALSQHYVGLNDIVARNKRVNFPAEGLTCALVEGIDMPSGIEAEEIKYYENDEDAVRAVNRGEADFVYGLSVRIEQDIQNGYLTNVIPIVLINSTNEIQFAIPRPADVDLLSIINKSLNNISSVELEEIAKDNLYFNGIRQFTLESLLHTNPVMFIGIITIICMLIVLTIYIAAHSKIHAAEMRAELEKTEADSKAKGAFLSRMSHEIRTPMNAIVGLTDITSMMEDVPGAVRANLIKIRSSAHYLLNLISDILDMSRIDNKTMTIAKEPFSLPKLLNEIETMIRGDAEEKGLRFTTEVVMNHEIFMGDSVRLKQILTNLLSNAVKFTPAGGKVRLSIEEVKADASGAEYKFSVEDNGIGISDDEKEEIFKAFVQTSNNYSRSQGTGLGLTISSNIVSLMGGKLELESETGRGSRFHFNLTLPYGQLPREEKEPVEADVLMGRKILLAEDNDLNAEIAIEMLKMRGAEVVLARNGRMAVEQFAASTKGEIQLILMDIRMPEMDGLQASHRIRELNREDAAGVPIIAMTANSFQEDMEAAFSAGMDAFIAKPFDVNYLYEVLDGVLKRKAAEQERDKE